MKLKNISLLDIVKYIKNSIDIIVQFKTEDLIDDYKSNKNENAASDYESLLQKEESAIRQHISYEHQIKIEYEKLLEKIEIYELENKLLLYQIVSYILFIYIIQDKDKAEYEENIEKLKNEIDDNKKNFNIKEKDLKEQLDMKEKEIIKLKTKIKALNSNYLYNKHNDITNNNSNLSMVLKSKANSSIYTSSKDDIDNNNKFKFDEFYTIFKDNIKSEEKIIRAEEESKKDIEDKYVKNKNKAQISRNIIKIC